MADDILTSPQAQRSEILQWSSTTFVLAAGVWNLIAGQQALRMTLTVLKGNFNDPIFVSPAPYGTVGLVSAILDPMPIQIHIAEWPGQIEGAWYALSSGGQTVTVIDTIRR